MHFIWVSTCTLKRNTNVWACFVSLNTIFFWSTLCFLRDKKHLLNTYTDIKFNSLLYWTPLANFLWSVAPMACTPAGGPTSPSFFFSGFEPSNFLKNMLNRWLDLLHRNTYCNPNLLIPQVERSNLIIFSKFITVESVRMKCDFELFTLNLQLWMREWAVFTLTRGFRSTTSMFYCLWEVLRHITLSIQVRWMYI